MNDYFNIEFEEFLAKYFNQRLLELRRTMTPERFIDIIKDLDKDQSKILEYRGSKPASVLRDLALEKRKS